MTTFERLEHTMFGGQTVGVPLLVKVGVVADLDTVALLRAASIAGGLLTEHEGGVTSHGVDSVLEQIEQSPSGVIIEDPHAAGVVLVGSVDTQISVQAVDQLTIRTELLLEFFREWSAMLLVEE